ncbi:hypothetical protein PF003_g13502 [Phytophthora fragariae]|nr:hypothetical protein PF003_g13502 [Phytophthora fragariae]
MADVLSDSQPPGLNLEMDMTTDACGSPDFRVQEADAVHVSTITPPAEMLHEAALRSGINAVLDETAGDEDELVCIREICQETLARMDRVTAEKSLAHRQECNTEAVANGGDVNDSAIAAFSPPKSPQDRLMALVPNAMEKSKSKLTRHPSPSYDRQVHILYTSVVSALASTVLTSMLHASLIQHFYSKDQSSGKAPISEIIAIFPERGEFVPSDYEVVRRRGVPANINTGTQGEIIYLCFKRSTTSAIIDLVVLFPRKNESLPYGSLAKSFEDELVSKIMCAYEATLINTKPTVEETIDAKIEQSSNALTRELVVDLIDEISTGAEIATITDNMLGVFKSHVSIQSLAFCHDICDAMNNYASSVAEKNALQLVVTFSKATNRKFVGLGETATESDQCSSVSSLRALNQTLLAAGTRAREQRVFGQVVRRFVLSTLNSTVLTWLPDVFRAHLTLVSTLWNHYRRYLKVELALMFEHVLLRILKATAPCAKNHQIEIMHEMTMWLQLPHNVVEIFLNFDLDRIQQWKIFEHLCSTLGSIGEGGQGNHIGNADDGDDSALELQNQAISTILAMARSIMDASGHAHLISRDQRTRMLSMDNGGWEQDESGEEASPMKDALVSATNGDIGSDQASQPNSPTEVKTHPGLKRQSSRKYGGSISIRMRNELQKHNQQLLKRAMEITTSKSLKKALEYLVAMNFIKDSPRSVTSFLRIYHDFFDETEIGDYLGEGDEDFKVQIRLTYVRAISFKGMTLVESLRHFLTNGGFRLPGEAQKIERMVEAFAQCYWDDSPTAFSSADTAMIIAYSIIMLNTDLHNPQVKKNKMSKDQFVKNNRGIDNGKDLPKRFLEEIYDDISHNPMHIKGSRVIPKASREASGTAADVENEKFRGGIAKAVAQSEELMKDLSHAYNTFQFVGVDTPISPDLIKLLFERVWFSLLTLSTSILCDSQSDLSTRMQCLDLLRYCISTCLFLNIPVERQAFCGLLRKLQDSLDGRHQEEGDEPKEDPVDNTKAIPDDKKYEWARTIEEAAASDDPWKAMGDIHLLVNDMKETIQVRQKSEKLDSVIQRIHRAHFYLKNSTTFIHEGDLTKKCRSRNQLYRFFLFNDQLLYADKSMTGRWSPHNSLRLKLTRISNIPDGVMSKHAFQIQNPIKSFVVFADSTSSKAEWMRLIDEAIAEASKKINRTARRISTQGLGDARPNSLVSAASTASTAMKVFMRFSSPMTSPTTERDSSQTSLDSEGESPVKPIEVEGTKTNPPDSESASIACPDESCQPKFEVDSNEERPTTSDTTTAIDTASV